MAEPVLCLRHKEHPRGKTSALAVLPFGTKPLQRPQKSGISTENLQLPLSPSSSCLRQLQLQIPFPAAPKKDRNTCRDVKNLLYAVYTRWPRALTG